MTSPGLAAPVFTAGCRRLLGMAMLPLLLSSFACVAAVGVDPLREPAMLMDTQVQAPLVDVTYTGEALLGVGLRGLIQRSEDGGKTWKQVPSPISGDLVSVRFSDARHGWIAGHDSVLLHTRDGENSWQVQLDGRRLLTLLRDWYGRLAKSGDPDAEAMLREIDMAMETSATPDVLASPFLDVLFDSRGNGFVVGAFGMILRSRDYGATWEPWVERTPNERRMHLYGLAEHNGVFYASGEQGLLMRLEPHAQRFVALDTGYGGTLFGVRAYGGLLLAYGLRGNLFASRDDGQHWQKIETGLGSSLVGIVERNRQLIVVGQDGRMLVLDSDSLVVTPLQSVQGGEVYAASYSGTGRLVMARFSGARLVEIAKAD